MIAVFAIVLALAAWHRAYRTNRVRPKWVRLD